MDAPDLTITYQNRLGYHYFPDTLHYREFDLQNWLPRLKQLGASWLVLHTDGVRTAVPEPFLCGLIEAGIQPILHMDMPLGTPIDLASLDLLLGAYARWGVRHIVLFNRPNARSAWPANGWTQQGLVDRFLDRYLPAANLALQAGLTPVFPPLEPGGSFWDTAFLRLALEALERRQQTGLLDHLMLSAYAWTQDHPLDWGTGGPERWPDTRPYFTPTDSQDQRGFRISDWYQAIAQMVLQKQVPVMLFQAGLPGAPSCRQSISDPELYVKIAGLCAASAENESDADALEPMSDMVMGCNFWLLSAETGSPYQEQALFDADGNPRLAGQALLDWVIETNYLDKQESAAAKNISGSAVSGHPIHHYLLLPDYPDGLSDWDWNVIRGYVKKYQPTVGFDMVEASLAEQVTLVGGEQLFSEEDLTSLRQAGCQIEWIRGDGMSIATQLAER
jgi:hypothetical protein